MLPRSITNSISSVLSSPFQDWITSHPRIAWMLDHPLWALGIVLVVILLSGGLLRAIAHLTEQIWLALLRAPIRLGRWMLRAIATLLRRTLPDSAKLEPENPQQRLADIVQRLDAIRQEQDQLLQEAKLLLAPKGQSPKDQSI